MTAPEVVDAGELAGEWFEVAPGIHARHAPMRARRVHRAGPAVPFSELRGIGERFTAWAIGHLGELDDHADDQDAAPLTPAQWAAVRRVAACR